MHMRICENRTCHKQLWDTPAMKASTRFLITAHNLLDITQVQLQVGGFFNVECTKHQLDMNIKYKAIKLY